MNSNERMFNEHDILYDVRLHIIIKFLDSFFELCHRDACLDSSLSKFIIRIRLLLTLFKKFGQKFLKRRKTL